MRDRPSGGLPLCVGRTVILGEAASRLAKLGDMCLETGVLAQLEDELATRGPERLVDAGQHATETIGSIHGEQAESSRIVGRAEGRESRCECLSTEHSFLALVEDPKARVDACRERVRAE